ncbi:MAG: hypothetical protein IPM32_18195 [Ignavibacteriae bacterium]|nr:hypothetical protein [Ignavibacteriota bacterium]
MSINDPGLDDVKVYQESYQKFSSSLRTWLIGFGIGAPVLFSSQAAFSNLVLNKTDFNPILILYLVGVSVQIFATLLYKISMWYIMKGALQPQFKNKRRYKFSDWLSDQLFIEIAFDLISIILFLIATYKVLIIYSSC